MKAAVVTLAFLAVIFDPCAAPCAVPQTMSFQGVLTDGVGNPYTGSHSVTFQIFTAPSGGAALWSETQNVTFVQGSFDVVLGAVTPLTPPFDQPYYLDMTVDGVQISPRSPLTASPYSLSLRLPFSGYVSVGSQALQITNGAGEGIRGSSFLAGGGGGSFGAAGVAGTNPSQFGVGVLGIANDEGLGVYGSSETGSGVKGFSYDGVGVDGTSSDGFGLFARSTYSYGIYAGSTNATGIYGFSAGNSGSVAIQGVNTGGGYGIAGEGPNIGVYANNSTYGHAVYLSSPCCAADLYGNVAVHGTLSKSAGSFKIDHPLDPENKTLSHSFVESPDMMNIYNGNVDLDGAGEAWIELPAWFEALNRDFRYQLTAIGAPGPNLYVASEISGNRFRIAGGVPGARVSWQVTGIRHDAYAEKHRIPVEEEKTAEARGHYLNPDAFGFTEDRGMELIAHPEAVELRARAAEAAAKAQAAPTGAARPGARK